MKPFQRRKIKTQQYGHKDLSEDGKQKPVGYKKHTITYGKNKYASQIKTDWCFSNVKSSTIIFRKHLKQGVLIFSTQVYKVVFRYI